MTAYSIIRIKKLKSWGAVAGAVAHNARTRETLNADPTLPADSSSAHHPMTQ